MIALARSLATYRGVVLPVVRRELAGWESRAAAIPDPALRQAASDGLGKRANVEATAVFATLAPRAARRAVIHASVALQVAIDYLDVLDEQTEGLAAGLELQGALGAAFGAPADGGRSGSTRSGEAGEEPGGDEGSDGERAGPADGGYLAELLAACREAAATLPAAAEVLPLAHREAIRCGEGQARTHAAAADPAALERWAAALGAPPELRWWEAAAGASSSVAAHALLALAARSGASVAEAELVAAAYDPWVGALTVILDDLVDREADRRAGQHNYLEYYERPEEAAARIDLLVAGAREAVQRLSRPRAHEAILTGVLAFYLGAAGADDPVAAHVRAARAPTARLLAALLRLS